MKKFRISLNFKNILKLPFIDEIRYLVKRFNQKQNQRNININVLFTT